MESAHPEVDRIFEVFYTVPDVQDSSYLSELGAHCDLSFTKVSGRDEPMTQFRAFPKSKFDAVYFSKAQ